MNAKTCLDILGISTGASLEEAKQSYKRLVKQWHPDQYGNDPEKQQYAHEKLTEINVAYREVVHILKNVSARDTFVPEGEETPERRREKIHTLKKKPSVFRRMTSFFRARNNNLGAGSGIRQDESMGRYGQEFDTGGQPASEFQKVLKRAVRNQPGSTVAGKSHAGNRKRAGLASRRPTTPGNDIPPKRCRGDRVEKIRPVRRVGKI